MLTKGFDHLGRPLPLSRSADEQGIGDRKRRPRMRLRIARPMPAIGKIGRSLSGRAISLTLIVLKSSINSSSAGVAASRARGLVSHCLIQARAVISSRVLDVSILVATATAIGVTILSVGNPLALFAEVKSAPQPGADQSTPLILTSAIQSPADPEALSPTHEIAAASVRASQPQTEKSEPSSSEALFRQFQAWAAEQDAPAKLGRDAQKHRSAARAEIQNTQQPRARIIQQQNARMQARPVQDARAGRDDPVPSFPQSLNPFACAFEKKCNDHVF
jgi:hypothetical protein